MIHSTLNSVGELEPKEIVDIIAKNDSDNVPRYLRNEAYFKGRNTAILNIADKEDGVPNNKIPVSYGRKICLTTKNYLFIKPISYTAENKEYISRLNYILHLNRNARKANKVGQDLIVHGRAYKLFYIDVVAGETVPRYTVCDVDSMIPVYDLSVEPKLIAAIRYYAVTDLKTNKKETFVEVYYSDKSMRFKKDGSTLLPDPKNPYENPFKINQVVVYGDEYEIGVHEPVKELIDAVDILISSDLNEVQRFELLYLLLIGDKLPEDDTEAQKVLRRRVLELSEKADAKYLEKHLDAEFNMSFLSELQTLIHKLSGVPDFESKDFSAQSGIALLYKLMGFEQLAADIESEFLEGELSAIDRVNALLLKNTDRYALFKRMPDVAVKIQLYRNLPEDVLGKLTEAKAMKDLGLSTESILDYIPMIENTEEELKRIQEEKRKNFAEFQTRFLQSEGKDEEEEDEE